MKVSVLMPAYNHGPFIAQAIGSVLQQEFDGDWELVIGEDRSSDDTREIVQDYAARHPGRIRALIHESNQGMYRNIASLIDVARGDYIAFLEGDDYWTDPGKLAFTTRLLDERSEMAIAFHQVQAFAAQGDAMPEHYEINDGVFPADLDQAELTIDDLLRRNFIQTCSSVIRRSVIGCLPDWLEDAKLLDWPLFVLAARHGKIGFIPRVMARYRVHPGGAWSMHGEQARRRDTIWMLERLVDHLDPPQRRIARNTLANLHLDSILYPSAKADDPGRLAHLRGIVANQSAGELFGPHSVIRRLPSVIAHRIKSS